MYKNNQRGFIQVLVLLLLLAGLGVGVYLVGQQTNLLPKAFESRKGGGLQPVPIASDSGTNVILRKSSPTPTPTTRPTPTPTPTPSPSPSPSPTPQYSRVFLTSTSYNGNLGGLSGADAKCQARADAANLGGTWKAWLSDGTTAAASRLTHSFLPYEIFTYWNKKYNIVANNWNDLVDASTNLKLNIEMDEYGAFPPNTLLHVWSNTNTDGFIVDSVGGHCNNWTSSDSSNYGRVGKMFSITKPDWTNDPVEVQRSCSDSSLHLYCFEQ